MEDIVRDYAVIRKLVQVAKDDLAVMESELKKTELWELIAYKKELIAELVESERVTRDSLDSIALQVFANESDKHPHPAVTIKENNKLLYDPADAIQWALKLEQMEMIGLNKSVFEKAAKALDLDFVEKRKEPSVTVSSDLSAYIEIVGIE